MTHLTLTEHAIFRAAQRGLSGNDIDLITMIGTEVPEGYLVRKKDCQEWERYFKSLLERIWRLEGKRVVTDAGCIVTVYTAKKSKQRNLLRRSEKRNSRVTKGGKL